MGASLVELQLALGWRALCSLVLWVLFCEMLIRIVFCVVFFLTGLSLVLNGLLAFFLHSECKAFVRYM